jgi:hypothetical protein
MGAGIGLAEQDVQRDVRRREDTTEILQELFCRRCIVIGLCSLRPAYTLLIHWSTFWGTL